MDQVLDNLLSNAIKFTPAKGRIEITAQQIDEQWIQVRVMDNGIGIPKKDIAFIFDRFYRADKARSRQMGGTGLGLSIAQTIIQSHGGSISLESDVRSGTMVTFTVPVSERGGEGDD
jgi:two-component system sensor histidine kinase VicK